MAPAVHILLLLSLLTITWPVQAVSLGVLDYVIPIPNLFNGYTDNGTGCTHTSEGDSLDCFDFNMNNHRLVDNDFGPFHSLSSTKLHRFLAWNRTQTQPVTLRFGFSPVSSLSSVVLYFFNYPTQRIGLPSVTLRGSSSSSGNPFYNISYLLDNNNALTNSDSQLRNLSLSIISNTNNIQLLFIDFQFVDPGIDWVLLSEVDICQGPPNANPVFESVTFQGGQSETVTLGPNSPKSSVRLSCTVTVSGSFQWTWQHNGDSLLSSERNQILTGDATRSSILVINKLNYTDEGTYSCVVNHVSQTEATFKTFTLQLLATINATAKQISVREGEAVRVSCEMYGYLRGEIEWLKDGQQVQLSGVRYSIAVRAGSREGQDGGETSVSSVVSQLTIQQVEQRDEGTYTCIAVGVPPASITVTTLLTTATTFGQSQVVLNTRDVSQTNLLPSFTPTRGPISTGAPFPIEAAVGIVIGIILIVILILLIACCCYMIKHRDSYTIRKVVAPEEPVYAEIKKKSPEQKKPRHSFSSIPLLEAEDVPDGRIGRRRPPPEAPIATQSQPPSDQVYHEIPDVPRPVKISAAAQITPSAYNPMYQPTEDVDAGMTTLLATSLPELTEEPPPPVPPYRATPPPHAVEGFNVPLGPSAFNSSTRASLSSLSSDDKYLAPYPSAYVEPAAFRKPDVIEITHENIKKVKDLGEGQYGPVLLAHTVGLSLKDLGLGDSSATEGISMLVAVKSLRKDCDSETKESFEKELKFLSRLKHDNVVRLMGACQGEEPFIMIEYMENGDLSQYLQEKEFTTQETRPLPRGKVNIQVLSFMCLQIANGMRYLASLNFIHRDLAARNCYVGANYKVKIADFGMSHNLYSSVYYRLQGRAMLPIRWMANECFYGRFSEKTDVWAFGITMWEIFTLCNSELFEGMTDQDVIDDAFRGPDRVLPPMPKICPANIYQVMLQCWVHEPEKRASFDELYKNILRIHNLSESAYSL